MAIVLIFKQVTNIDCCVIIVAGKNPSGYNPNLETVLCLLK